MKFRAGDNVKAGNSPHLYSVSNDMDHAFANKKTRIVADAGFGTAHAQLNAR